jgi:hypothetical protein
MKLVAESGETFEIPILVDGGPLAVGPVWNFKEDRKLHPTLSFIYFKKWVARIGPYYANLALAERDMRKVLKEFRQQNFWEQSLDWYRRTTSLHQWIDANLGRPEYLIGGRWAREEES